MTYNRQRLDRERYSVGEQLRAPLGAGASRWLASFCLVGSLACNEQDQSFIDNGGPPDPATPDSASPAAQPAPPAVSANVELVNRVLVDGIENSNPEIVDRYVRDDFIQHGSLQPDGKGGLLIFASLADKVRSQVHRVISDGNLVAMHVTHTLPDHTQLVAFDVYRVEGGQLAEHWDAVQAPAGPSPSGHGMTDGATEVGDLAATDDNRALVRDFVNVVLRAGQIDRMGDFLSSDGYAQHDPRIADDISGLRAFATGLADQGLGAAITAPHLTIAEGNFVLVASEGTSGPLADPRYAIFYDLFRVSAGRIVEHWDVLPPSPNPALLPHPNGYF